ncbi:MAG: HAMP domain-containing protein [Chloroflexi bacterium]|nr:HAMP domain-containing protein [Chloroflexota bacterium]
MNLRARLTLWYTSVLAVVLLVFGALVYLILWFSLTQQIDQLLEDRANDILRASQGSVRNVGVVVSLPPLEVFSTPNVYVQVWDNQGRLSASSANLGQYAQPLDPARLSVVRSTGAHDVTIQRTHLRVITHPIQVGAQIFGWLQIGASLEAVDRARDYLLLLLTGGILIAVAVSALLGWNTTSQALRPIHAVTEAALQITRADDLSRRIPQIGPPTDEVGRLVAAFNDTLERLEALFNTQRRFLADISHD